MSTTITIRASEQLKQALGGKAALSGKTVSELVREILEDAVGDRPLRLRVGHLRGRLGPLHPAAEPWRKRLRDRNWRT
jgi:hypothetical protein